MQNLSLVVLDDFIQFHAEPGVSVETERTSCGHAQRLVPAQLARKLPDKKVASGNQLYIVSAIGFRQMTHRLRQ